MELEEECLSISWEAIAIHEAGHAIAAVALGKKMTRLSIIAVGDEPRGCVCECAKKEPEWKNIICDLMGPRAQIEYCKYSIVSEKRDSFCDSVLPPQAMTSPRELAEYYSNVSVTRSAY